jgi:hypothetical protein
MHYARRVVRAGVPIVLGFALLVSASTVAAQGSHVCPPGQWGNQVGALTAANQFQAGWTAGDPNAAMTVAGELEDAWREADRAAALALFADTAVATGPGSRWQGKQELASFLDRMWDPTYSSDVSRIETTGRCALGGRVLWLFVYPETGATGSIDLLVQGGSIVLISWNLTPAGVVEAADSLPEPPVEVEMTWPVARAALLGVTSTLALLVAIGILHRQRGSAGERSPDRRGQLLRGLRESTLDRRQHPPS